MDLITSLTRKQLRLLNYISSRDGITLCSSVLLCPQKDANGSLIKLDNQFMAIELVLSRNGSPIGIIGGSIDCIKIQTAYHINVDLMPGSGYFRLVSANGNLLQVKEQRPEIIISVFEEKDAHSWAATESL